ncbi:hypothetical protein DFH05DRAFT_1461546 [Lentinula detonsa]|uniref:Uncharacterized protein n=1 Tax=Lentinula detonsa TaxID=2804962 RepID=A0A9W8NX09_9AGAR|nr:hypothetical protein DFH05DRAFT_1461546 [Lentinula detonsa]
MTGGVGRERRGPNRLEKQVTRQFKILQSERFFEKVGVAETTPAKSKKNHNSLALRPTKETNYSCAVGLESVAAELEVETPLDPDAFFAFLIGVTSQVTKMMKGVSRK